MDNKRSEIIAEVTTRQNIEAEVIDRVNIVTEIASRQTLDADVTTRQEIEATVEMRVVDGGYYAAVRDETLHLQKAIDVDGNGLVLNG